MITKRKSIQTITDPLLEPFFITKDEYSYAVKEIIKSDADHFRSKGKGKEYEKSLYYYPKFGQAISKIAELKAQKGNFDSMEKYLNNYKLISNQIKNYTDGIRSAI
jgi:hypothetical protein|tara:strand:- start:823 stop:1140 length:318 start_codon:yes stop_codon:yes gene_type:complete